MAESTPSPSNDTTSLVNPNKQTPAALNPNQSTEYVGRQRSKSKAPFSKDMFVIALHVYNNRGVKGKNERTESRIWHFKEMHAKQAVENCVACKQEINSGDVYYLNYPNELGTKWAQGVDQHCEFCMGLRMRKELGQDDEAIRKELELIKQQNPGECLIC